MLCQHGRLICLQDINLKGGLLGSLKKNKIFDIFQIGTNKLPDCVGYGSASRS